MHNINPSNKKIIHISAWARTFTQFRLPLIKKLGEIFGRQVICCPHERKHVEKLTEEGFEIINCEISSRFEPGIFRQMFTLYKLLQKEKFDVVVAHQPMGALVGLPPAYFAGVPIKIYSTGGLKYSPDNKSYINILYKYGELLIMKITDAVLAVNIEDFDYLQKIKSLSSKAYYVGPRGGCGIDTNKFNPDVRKSFRNKARDELGIPNTTVVIGYTGRVVREKGFREIIESAKILRRMELKHMFLILGEGPDFDQIRKQIYSESLDDCFTFLGYKFRIDYYMSAFDIFILPSYREGLPISLLEAMAMGIPCIASDIRGSRQLIVNKKTGILIPARDSEALANAIYQYARFKDFADNVSSKASDEIAAMYSENIMLESTLQTLLKIAEKNLTH